MFLLWLITGLTISGVALEGNRRAFYIYTCMIYVMLVMPIMELAVGHMSPSAMEGRIF